MLMTVPPITPEPRTSVRRLPAFTRLAALLLAAAGAALPLASAQADALPMWTVHGASNEVHILGSIHYLKPGRDRLPPAMISAYEQADILVMEIDMDDVDPLATQATLQRLGVDPGGRTLDILLGQGDYRTASASAKAIGLDLELLRAFEPWLATLMISQLQLAQLGFDADSGVEQQLVALARRDSKEIRGLETLEEQLAAIDSLPAATQRQFLLKTLEEAATLEEQVDQIVAAWKRGDARVLQEEFLDGLKEQPDLYRRIVVERNRNWTRQMEPLLRDRRDYLVVVGTLHLVGPDSLIGMLERAGHDPRQVGVND